MKRVVFAAMLLTLLLSFCTVLADQDGRNCWCNIDEYGCWITDEDGGKNYIMFWSEEARVYIMGTGSAPYKYVVAKPESAGILPMECGRATSVLNPSNRQESDSDPEEPPAQSCKDVFNNCHETCKQNRGDCFDHCSDNGDSCESEYTNCKNKCETDYNECR